MKESMKTDKKRNVENGMPLVTVGIPTYNRVATCKGAIESVLAQEYSHLELIISDNASTDGTEEMCREFAAEDHRIRYIRQETNQGATKNFVFVEEKAQGKYFMWLSDDDWIDPTYLFQCVSHLEAALDVGLVAGKTSFYADDETSPTAGKIFNYTKTSPAKRVLSYYKTVSFNEIFYGVARREYIASARSALQKNVVGNDWLVAAALIFQGQAKTIETTTIHRDAGGNSASIEGLARSLGLHPFQGKHYGLSIAWFALCDIMGKETVYAVLPVHSRIFLGMQVFNAIFYRLEVLPRVVRLLRIVAPKKLYRKLRDHHRQTRDL